MAAPQFVSLGISVLAYDWRGRGKSSGDYAHTSMDTHVDDFGVVVDWLITKQGVASEEILGVGFSLGAVVILKHIKRGSRLGAIVGWSPAFRPALDMWPRYNSPEIEAEVAEHGVARKPGSDDVLIGRAVLDYLRDTDLGADALVGERAPALICHGTGDTRIPHATSELVAAAAAAGGGGGVELVLFPGATHSFRPAEQFHAALFAATARWIHQRFPPAPGPARPP